MQYALKFLRKVMLKTRKYDRMTEINKSEFIFELYLQLLFIKI